MDYDKALKYIYSRELFGIKLGLKNIKEMMESLGNPQDKFKSIHVAGTNGKGSVCSLVSSVLRQQGYKIGVYTSPHLVDFRERIQVNGKKITKPKVVSLIKKIKPLVKDHTFFEIVTALAFLYFAEQKVDFVVVEVGMGGRLDATNIINPELSVITNISLEHTDHLGKTINKIAGEKAGIIKEGIDVVMPKGINGESVIKKICKEKKCRIHVADKKKIKTSLQGTFQYKNASIAVKVIEVLRKQGVKISEKAQNSGLKTAKWPGRFEFISENIIFDCAHNPAGAKVLAEEIRKMKKEVYLVLGIMKDKNIKGICQQLQPIAKEVIITKPHIPRSAMPEKISEYIQKKVTVIKDVTDALEYAKLKAGKKGLIVLTGSIFTVGDAFSVIRPEPFDADVYKRRIQ